MTTPDFSKLNAGNIVAFLEDIFLRRGAEAYIGEPVTISQHMLQSAVQAQEAGADEELIVAALLHDIGHFTNEFPDDAAELGIDANHEEAGAKVLERFFPPRVTESVRCHVSAKRFMCATNPHYFDKLSEASILSLELQGGPMGDAEVEAFRNNPDHRAAIQVRVWDDRAKIADMETPSFADYAPMVQRVVDGHTGNS